MENIDIRVKALHESWTAQNFTVNSLSDVDILRERFNKYDKKIKVSCWK